MCPPLIFLLYKDLIMKYNILALCKFVVWGLFIHQWLYTPLLGPGLFFSFVIFFTQTVGLLGQVISPLQGRYLHAGQHKHRINAHRHPCLECNSKPWSQRSGEWRQFMPQTARPLWSAYEGYNCTKFLISGLAIVSCSGRTQELNEGACFGCQ
jgi:hypothetical protein